MRPEFEGLQANPDKIMDALSTDDSFIKAIENAGMVYLAMFVIVIILHLPELFPIN